MTVESLFKQRSSIHIKQLSRYMKYVLNDHFVLALLLLLGAAGFGYSNYVQVVEQGAIIPRLILLLLLTGAVSIGKIANLMQQADMAFLLPMESSVYPILKKSVWKSLILLSLPLSFVSVAAMPLLASTMGTELTKWPIFVMTTILLKAMDLNVLFMTYFERDAVKRMIYLYLAKGVILVGFSISVFGNLLSGMIFSAIIALIVILTNKMKNNQAEGLQWHYVIEKEENRQQMIYRFINLFTEVSFVKSHPKRLKFLDKLIAYQSSHYYEPHYFYIVRSFYRNPSFSSLVVRLALIGGLFISFAGTSPALTLLIALLFLYLIGFQLMPIYQQFRQNFYFQLYPIEETGKIKSIQRLITEVLAAIVLIFTGAGFSNSIYSGGSILVGGILFVGMFTRMYLPKRLNRMEQY